MRNDLAEVIDLRDFRRATNSPSYPTRHNMSFERGELYWLLSVRHQFNAYDSQIIDNAINSGCSHVASFIVYAKGSGGKIGGDVTFQKSFETTKGGVFYTVVKNGCPSFGTKYFRSARDIFEETIADSYGSLPMRDAEEQDLSEPIAVPALKQEAQIIKPDFGR